MTKKGTSAARAHGKESVFTRLSDMTGISRWRIRTKLVLLILVMAVVRLFFYTFLLVCTEYGH